MAASKVQQADKELKQASPIGKLVIYLKTLGPGLITGASDDDPSGIGTYSQTGAQFGYGQLWTALFTFPLMTIIQEMCARIGMQTGSGLAEVLRKHYPKPILYACVSLLFFANVINLGADLGAMAASAQMLFGIPFIVWLVAITLLSVALQVFVSYSQYANVLRLLTLSLFVYLIVPFVAQMDWGQALRSTVVPSVAFNKDYALNLVAILGTTISPYLFFWQASQEVEEEVKQGRVKPQARHGVSRVAIKWMRTDVTSGMLLSNVVTWFIIATTASTLFRSGVHDIDSATKAAEALKPVAGSAAYSLFAIGIIGTGLLAVPVLAGSGAYAIAEAFKLREGLYLKLKQAPGFYSVIIISVAIGFAMNLIGVNPMQALYYTAILNGIVAPPLLVMIMLIGNNRKIMQDKVNGRVSNIVGWVTTVFMTVAAAALLVSLALGGQ